MAERGRLDLVRTSLGLLTDELRDDDSLSLVTFSDEAKTLLPMTRLGDHRRKIHKPSTPWSPPTPPTSARASARGTRSQGYEEAVDGHRVGANDRVVLLSDALAGALWGGASPRLQVTAVAEYFAQSLRGAETPGAPALGELASRARRLAVATEDDAVARLATAIGQADEITDGGRARSGGAGEGEMD